MIKTILSISGRPGLFKLVSQGKNMLIVESLSTGKRVPAYAHDKIISLGDISIYTMDEDISLAKVFESIKEKNEGKEVDLKSLNNDNALREYFETILPDYDQDRVYTNDIKKVFNWYNQLIVAGFDKFIEENNEETETNE